MKTILKVTNPIDITKAVEYLHDCIFDYNKIYFNKKEATLSIPFNKAEYRKKTVLNKIWLFQKNKIPVVKYILKINNVESYEIREGKQAGPGSEDYFNKISYSNQKRSIYIHTVISEGIIVLVGSLELYIHDTYEVIDEEIKLSLKLSKR